MTTWAQVISNTAENVLVGADLADLIAPGYDGGNSGVSWQQVPDGTLSGATTNDGGATFTNPVVLTPTPQPLALTKSQFEALYVANGSNIANTLANWPTG